MAADDELQALARRVVATVSEQIVSKVPADQQEHVRRYWDVRGGLFRQLAQRVVQGLRNQLRENEARDWALQDLLRTILAKAESDAARRQFASWFEHRRAFLGRLSADFWKLASALEQTVGDKALAIGLTAKLLADYLTHPLTSEFDPKVRTEANLAAIRLLASGAAITLPKQRLILAGYTGWGGLSIERVADQLPVAWMPSSEALIHEYYTPPLLCFELARVLRPFVARLSGSELRALEPSAGIGRFVNALSLQGYERVRWTAVEYSNVSAEILRHLRPDIRVIQGSFESFVSQEEAKLAGQLHLVVTNPPYGERGKTMVEDKHPAYRLKDAYPYFLFRSADLLAPLCYAAFVIPYGFLTGRNAEQEGFRRRLLARHHLLAAFRLPSSLFPGASIVTDLLLLQRRERELAELPAEDAPIVEGKYFEAFPAHVLGKEVRSEKVRFGYEVTGTFTRLPDFTERPLCSDCAVAAPPTRLVASQTARTELPVFLLPEEIQTAISLGDRIAKYLGLLSSSADQQRERAFRQHSELLDALTSYKKLWGIPRQNTALIEHRFRPQVLSLLAAFDDSGEIVAQLRNRPAWQPSLGANEQTLAGVASFLYRTERAVTLDRVVKFWQSTLLRETTEPATRRALISAGWCVDGREWLPEADYYTGHLWPRYDRAVALQDDPILGDTATSQAKRLLSLIEPVSLSVIEPDPRLAFIPLAVLRNWLTTFTGIESPALERRNQYLLPQGMPQVDLHRGMLAQDFVCALGFLNFDYALFRIKNAPREIDAETGKEEAESVSQDRARLKYESEATLHFRRFLSEHVADGELVVEAYNRTFRGWIEPTYSSFVMPARWGNQVELREHQKAGAARLLSHLGGLLAFDVGVGKTFTGVATLAKLREEGKAKRPVVILPNTIVWQWAKALQRAIPDIRVLVIGAERYLRRSGAVASRTDKPEERTGKWRVFQAGGADVVLCTYTTFAKAATRPESREAFAWSSPPLLGLLGLEARDAELDAAETDDTKKKKQKKKPTEASKQRIVKQFGASMGLSAEEIEKAAETAALNVEREREAERQRIRTLIASLSSYSERERAILQHRIARWASLTAEREDADPDVYWEDLGIDALMVDEAQNFKNLWPVALRPNQEMPKYLGGIDKASQRAMELAVRAFLVRQRNGGSGVYLLSATPAKNSPLEYFSLLSYVDGDAWARLGISDTARFISRYLKIERRQVLDTDLQEIDRDVVTGFVNIPELREIIYRFAEFRTAEEVGLKLPKTEPKTVKVQMDEQQQQVHSNSLVLYRELISDRSAGARNKALGILMQLSLVTVHPELVTSRPEKGWSGKNWNRVQSIHSPKLDHCAEEVSKRPRCGHIIYCEPLGAQYFLREVLAKKGIPKERIAILNAEEAPTSLSRQVIAERFNGSAPILDDQGNVEQEGEAPAYDVVIANSVAYEGIDLHIRTCVVHHLDLPWEPATLQQRNGRAVRQGNTQAVIGILYYIAQGSIDAARLTIILGKLTWMKDILASSDRETNNPAAGSDLSNDELVMFLYSPDELSTIRARMQDKKEQEDRRAARRRAWQICKRIYDSVLLSGGAETNHAVRELMRQLGEIPAKTWPWHGVVIPQLLRGRRFAFLDLRYRAVEEDQPGSAEEAGEDMIVTVPLWEGAVFASGAVQIEVATVTADSMTLRFAGSIEWIQATPLGLNNSRDPQQLALYKALRRATPDQYDHAKWPQTIDKLSAEQRLEQVLDTLSDSLSPLGMKLAPDAWRRMVWEYFGKRVLDRLRRLAIPVDRGPLTVVAAALGPTTPQPLPWTDEGFARFVERGQSTNLRWNELNQISLAWFERPFPTGGRQQVEQEIDIILHGGAREKRSALWVGNGVAVLKDKDLYSLTVISMGKAAEFFSTKGKAERFGEWLQSLPLHWEATDMTALVEGFPRPSRISTVGKWIEAQPRVPTLAEVVVFFEGL